MFEFWEMLTKSVRLRKCKRCGKYFIMKGNYDTNYCDRVAQGETRNCQELAAQENYKKKMADNAAIPLYQKYYKRYAARVKVRQIKEADFKKWKYQAMTKRDECSDAKITLSEFEEWLESSFPNRKKKNWARGRIHRCGLYFILIEKINFDRFYSIPYKLAKIVDYMHISQYN